MYAAYLSKFSTWISINRRHAIMSTEMKDFGKQYQKREMRGRKTAKSETRFKTNS